MNTNSRAVALAVFLLTVVGCRADAERAEAEAPRAARVESESPVESYTISATLVLLDVGPRGRALRARFRLQNPSDGIVSYEGCAAGKPVWHWQYFDGGAWKDGGALLCDGKTTLYELAPEEALKFDVELEASRPSSRVGVRVVTPGKKESTLIWSETVYYEAAPPP